MSKHLSLSRALAACSLALAPLIFLYLGLAYLPPAGVAASQGLAATSPLPIYSDTVASGWQDWSWGGITRDFGNGSPMHSGMGDRQKPPDVGINRQWKADAE